MVWQWWPNAQYSKRKCLHIIQIPLEFTGQVLAVKVLNIFDKRRCVISPELLNPALAKKGIL